MEDEYPYETFYGKIDEVLSRDNYTCQVCGRYGVGANDVVVTRCLECERKEIPFQPSPNSRIPKPCKEKGLTYRVCAECPEFRESSIEYVSHASLVVHHLDGNKRNQDLRNLATVCLSCHRRLHPRGKILSIETVKGEIGKSDDEILEKIKAFCFSNVDTSNHSRFLEELASLLVQNGWDVRREHHVSFNNVRKTGETEGRGGGMDILATRQNRKIAVEFDKTQTLRLRSLSKLLQSGADTPIGIVRGTTGLSLLDLNRRKILFVMEKLGILDKSIFLLILREKACVVVEGRLKGRSEG